MDVPTGPVDVVVLGASAGAHAAVITLLSGLPSDFSTSCLAELETRVARGWKPGES